MSTSLTTVSLQSYTRLPLRVVVLAEKLFPDIVVKTPHKGDITVPLKQEHHPFLFGSVTQTEVHLEDVVDMIKRIEGEATDYLWDQWYKGEPAI